MFTFCAPCEAATTSNTIPPPPGSLGTQNGCSVKPLLDVGPGAPGVQLVFVPPSVVPASLLLSLLEQAPIDATSATSATSAPANREALIGVLQTIILSYYQNALEDLAIKHGLHGVVYTMFYNWPSRRKLPERTELTRAEA